jgi:hypothetical protein
MTSEPWFDLPFEVGRQGVNARTHCAAREKRGDTNGERPPEARAETGVVLGGNAGRWLLALASISCPSLIEDHKVLRPDLANRRRNRHDVDVGRYAP